MRQTEPLFGGSAAKEQGAHGGCLAYAGRCYGGRDVGHGVVDGETGGHAAAGRIDVEVYGLFGGVGFEEKELRYDRGRDGLVDWAVEADYSLLR